MVYEKIAGQRFVKECIKHNFEKLKVGVAEWSALQTGKRGDSGSIPARVKSFFSEESLVSNNTLLVVLNSNSLFE